ncbi:MAG: type II and III secretion system protein family protein [Alphaproteobacteria bacterium]|nr:type II and III secretion system protein family protein [Alphaproteobacteria bacterium]
MQKGFAALGAMLFLATALFAAATGAALAETATHLQVSRSALGATQHVEVGLNKSLIVDLPLPASEVIVSSPAIAGAVMRSKQRAIIQGATIGETNIFFLDGNGARIAVLEVSVTQDSAGLEAMLARLLPGSRISAETMMTSTGFSSSQRIVLSGWARSADDVDKAVSVAAQYAGGEANVANLITVSGSQQVALKVTVAEVSRETVKQLGINLNATYNTGGLTTSLINLPGLGGASNVIPSGTATVGIGVGGLSLTATIKALERRGALRTLAEPTLTALSGQEAEFLAGGEYPVPSGIDNGVVSFSFQEFGVKLKFTPVVKSNGIVALTVETSVSEPTTEGGFTIGGITVPATKERQAKTSVELQSGSTLAIAGIIQDQVRQQINELPGLAQVPILGALFRSRDFIHSQTELMILVTPVLAEAGPSPVLPTDRLRFSSDAEAIFLGRMESLYGVGGECDGCNSYQGRVGFVLD